MVEIGELVITRLDNRYCTIYNNIGYTVSLNIYLQTQLPLAGLPRLQGHGERGLVCHADRQSEAADEELADEVTPDVAEHADIVDII